MGRKKGLQPFHRNITTPSYLEMEACDICIESLNGETTKWGWEPSPMGP